MKIDIVLDVKTVLGEGPLWDVDQERLYWIDSKDARIFRATADGRELRSWLVPAPIGSMALTKDGTTAVTALATGLHLLDFATGETTFISDPEAGNPNNRLNDGKVDRRGRYVFGSMDTQEDERSGRLYRMDPDYSVSVLDDKLICSNGPCWSPDDSTFYFSDTWSGGIWAYDYDIETGTVSNRRDFGDHRNVTGRRFRRIDSRRRRRCLERPGLRRQDRPVHPRRHRRPDHRNAGQKGHQRHVRRTRLWTPCTSHPWHGRLSRASPKIPLPLAASSPSPDWG